MKNRYNQFVIEAEEGITFEASEGTSGELIIKARKVRSENSTVLAGEYAEVLSVYTDKYGNQAVVPPGWTVSGVSKENTIWGKNLGLVIYCIPKEKVYDIDWTKPKVVETLQKTYDQFVWIPVSLLKANGTLDGKSFTEKFGRRNNQKDDFSEREYHEPLVGRLIWQKKSVDKYGGYYTSRYKISKDKKTRKPRSIEGADPWVKIKFPYLKKVAATMIKSETTTSHLMYGAEYDTQEEWRIETKTKKPNKIADDMDEWTQEQNNSSFRVIRDDEGYRYSDFTDAKHNNVGFRITMCIK